MPSRPPLLAVLLGATGVVPFLACALGVVASTDAAESSRFLLALVGYGAVILAFLGGVHWGFVLSPVPGDAEVAAGRTRYRLLLGVTPSLVGWVALLLMMIGLPDLALALILAGFVAVTAAEVELNRRGLLPPGYMLLRWILSIVVALLLATVLVLRLVGGRIIF